MATTTYYGWPYPSPTDSVDIPRDIKALADKLETIKTGLTIPSGQIVVGDAASNTHRGYYLWRNVSSTPYQIVQSLYNSATSGINWDIWKGSTLAYVCSLRFRENGQLELVVGPTVRPVPFATYQIYASTTIVNAAWKTVTINLPTGRFTFAPGTYVSSFHGSYYGYVDDTDKTFVTVGVRHYDGYVTPSTFVGFNVLAIQMLAGAGSGRSIEAPAPQTDRINCTATCHVDGCDADGIPNPIRLYTLESEVICGVCGQIITDVVEITSTRED